MAPRSENPHEGITLKDPTNRKPFNTVEDWLEGKRADDGAEGLWRVHDKIYDFTRWMRNHPGGKRWLEMTKGTDITEAFESSHLSDTAEKMLGRFYVRDAKSPRNSLITFHEKGFFRTLKRKIRDRKLMKDTAALPKTKLLADSLAIATFLTGLLGTVHNLWWAVLSGVLLNMLAVCAHNFFHMKDNWRMYYFSLSLMSLSEWRVSHVLSHHFYPNTKLDLEVSMFEPIFRFLPAEDKKFRHLSWFVSPFVMATMAHFQFTRRFLEVFLSKKLGFETEELFGFLLPLFFFVFGGQGLWRSYLAWNVVVISASFSFGLIGLTAAHHHPDIYHDGDFLGHDRDFGLLQLAAVRDRADVDGNFLLTLVMFGEHALHHMFPTVDHGRLPLLDSVLRETCEEFGINHRPLKIKNLVLGMFQQLVRNYKNTRLMIASS